MDTRTKQTAGTRRRGPIAMVAIMVSMIALAVALSSTATAALMVGSNQIKKNAVKSKHIAKDAVKPKHIKKNAIKPRHLSPKATANLTGPAGPQGDPGLSGVELVTKETSISGSPHGAVFTASVSCPAGKVALGGGYVTSFDVDLQLAQDRPSGPDGNLWVIFGKNFGDPGAITVSVVCASVQ